MAFGKVRSKSSSTLGVPPNDAGSGGKRPTAATICSILVSTSG